MGSLISHPIDSYTVFVGERFDPRTSRGHCLQNALILLVVPRYGPSDL